MAVFRRNTSSGTFTVGFCELAGNDSIHAENTVVTQNHTNTSYTCTMNIYPFYYFKDAGDYYCVLIIPDLLNGGYLELKSQHTLNVEAYVDLTENWDELIQTWPLLTVVGAALLVLAMVVMISIGVIVGIPCYKLGQKNCIACKNNQLSNSLGQDQQDHQPGDEPRINLVPGRGRRSTLNRMNNMEQGEQLHQSAGFVVQQSQQNERTPLVSDGKHSR